MNKEYVGLVRVWSDPVKGGRGTFQEWTESTRTQVPSQWTRVSRQTTDISGLSEKTKDESLHPRSADRDEHKKWYSFGLKYDPQGGRGNQNFVGLELHDPTTTQSRPKVVFIPARRGPSRLVWRTGRGRLGWEESESPSGRTFLGESKEEHYDVGHSQGFFGVRYLG